MDGSGSAIVCLDDESDAPTAGDIEKGAISKNRLKINGEIVKFLMIFIIECLLCDGRYGD